ncbi:MAG: helix-turn-helix domain-containing protein [Nanoarchaeota archaeon]|nr:helix-turn-helix domain-containing protein [Nanoarchaeota archaeon]
MKAEHIEILQNLGLTSIESKVYLTLVEIGKSLAGTVAERAHIHRRNTYDALERLLQMGLVSYTILNNMKYWNAVHPEKIKSLLKEKENLISSMLPELIAKHSSLKLKQKVEVFEGLGGMKTFFNDMIKTEKEIIMLFATGRAYPTLPYYMKSWDSRLNKNRIKVKVLLNADGDKEPYKNYKFGEVRILPKNFSTPTQIFIYGNKSAVVIWSEEPIAILINGTKITNGFRNYFEFLWQIGTEVKY